MITPSKAISFRESITYKMLFILDEPFDEITLVELYKSTKHKFQGLNEFIFALDALYILGEIDVELKLGKIRRC